MAQLYHVSLDMVFVNNVVVVEHVNSCGELASTVVVVAICTHKELS